MWVGWPFYYFFVCRLRIVIAVISNEKTKFEHVGAFDLKLPFVIVVFVICTLETYFIVICNILLLIAQNRQLHWKLWKLKKNYVYQVTNYYNIIIVLRQTNITSNLYVL